MFRPSNTLQNCFGFSSVVLSVGLTGALLTGAYVKINVAGTNILVNSKLQEVEKIKQEFKETIEDSSTIPTVPKRKIRAIEKKLEDVEADIDRQKEKVEEDLENLVDRKGL